MTTNLFAAAVVGCTWALCATAAPVATAPGSTPDDQYVLSPDSQTHADVPTGSVSAFTLEDCKAFPGTRHKWWLYLPAQYDGKRSIALMVFFDGGSLDFVHRDGPWRVPVVLDNLIAKQQIPVMAAVFVDPGQPIGSSEESDEQRSYEYDTLGGENASFLVDELLVEVRKRVLVTNDPAGRGIAGRSSGGIAAFTVAWRRPDQFRRVFSANGSFVNVRGGGAYPEIIRKSEKRPIRVFLQDGVKDELGGEFDGLNWPEGNRQMAAALAVKGYEYNFVMGEGTHSSRHGASIFPNAMRWLWQGYRPR